MSDEKTMLPELLPAPKPVIPSVSPRERVVKHWHTLMTAGAATAALAGCGCLVMDPIPPPAQCRTTRSLLADVGFIAFPNASGSVTLSISMGIEDRISMRVLSVEGALPFAQPTPELMGSTELIFQPTGSGPITVIFTTTCEGTAATSIKVVLTPQGVDAGTDAGPTGWTVSATDL